MAPDNVMDAFEGDHHKVSEIVSQNPLLGTIAPKGKRPSEVSAVASSGFYTELVS